LKCSRQDVVQSVGRPKVAFVVCQPTHEPVTVADPASWRPAHLQGGASIDWDRACVIVVRYERVGSHPRKQKRLEGVAERLSSGAKWTKWAKGT
jgi:hypothetical protein